MKKQRHHSLLVFTLFILWSGCRNASNQPAAIPAVTLSANTGLYLPNDLEATLWAESPLLYNPTNLDVDVRGRIWVTEAVNYRTFNNDSTKALHHTAGDRIMILEDTNGDGRADSSKVFVQDRDLLSPVGLAVIGNKVVVSCSPNLIVYTDENGDDKPDKKEILLTGFGGKDHDHSLHAVYAGPDGRWYFNVGNAGPHHVRDRSGWNLHSGSIATGGSPYALENSGNQRSDDGKVWVGGLALRVNPDGTGLTVLGHNFRNSYEVFPDSYGNLWQNDNDDQVVTCRTSWLMEGGNAGYFSTDGTRYWQADQRPGQDMFSAHWHQDDPGVMPAGDRTGAGSPTGVVRLESNALGVRYRGMLLSADAGRNVIFGYQPALHQSGFDLGKRSNLVSSIAQDNEGYVWNDSAQNEKEDKWFRPSDVTVGTDGALYIADWYDPVVGGHQMQDKKGYGRIYRITPKGKKLLTPKFDLTTVEGQVQALKSPVIHVRHAGFEALRKKGDAALRDVQPLLQDENSFVRARAVWLLAQLGPRGQAEVERLLSDADVELRATAYRALRQTTTDILPYAEKRATDTSAFIRREVAISLRDLPYAKTKTILLQLLDGFDGTDRWYLEAVGAALQGHEEEIYPELVTRYGEGKPAAQWNKKMAALAWQLHPAAAISDLSLLAQVSPSPPERQAFLTALGFINTKTAASEMMLLSKSAVPDVAEGAAYWLSFRQSNDWQSLLNWKNVAMNTAYERKLAQMKVKRGIILDKAQPLNERKWRAEELAEDSVGGQLLIGLAAEKKIPADLSPFIEAKIFQNPNATVRMQAGDYFKRPGTNTTFSIAHILKLAPDRARGKTAFTNHCATCHKWGTEGGSIGPELTTIGNKFDESALLDAIINPSAAIVFGYEPWLVNKRGGESLYGFLISENKQSLVLRDVGGQKHVIPIKEISSRKKGERSLMPDPAALGLTEQHLADIAAFLRNGQLATTH